MTAQQRDNQMASLTERRAMWLKASAGYDCIDAAVFMGLEALMGKCAVFDLLLRRLAYRRK